MTKLNHFQCPILNHRCDDDLLISTMPKRLFAEEPLNLRALTAMHANESPKYSGESIASSNEWIRSNMDDSSDIPRPMLRNVINLSHGSAVTVLTGSSSSSNRDASTPLYANPTPKQIQVLPSRAKSAAPRASSAIRPPTNASIYDDLYGESLSEPRFEPSTPILTDTINTGSDFR